MEYLIIGVMVGFNLLIVIWKLTHKRVFDGLIDAGLLIAVTTVFSGGLGTLIIGTIGSAITSLYLLIVNPFKSKSM